MEDEELTPQQLVARYLARRDWREGGRTGPPPGGVSDIWQRWIERDSERAWITCIELVRLRPADDEILEHVWYRLSALVERYGPAFETRVEDLVSSNELLQRVAAQLAREAARDRPRPFDIPALVEAYLHNQRHAESAHELNALIREDPETAVSLAIEIIERGPQYEFTSFDTFSPLHELLRKHGEEVIAEVERAATDSVLVRRCLWRMRRQRSSPPSPVDIKADVWIRVLAATARTTDYNSDDVTGARRALAPEYERIIASWFEYEQSFWAWERVGDLVRMDPEVGWRVLILAIERATDDDDVLGSIGAGPLEDLLSKHGSAFIERIETRAPTDPALREALSAMWQSDMSDALWARVQQLLEPESPW